MLPIFRQHLERAQLRMERQANKKRMERQFLVGDMVYLRLQPYVQTSVAQRSSQKLAFKYFGPYKVLKRVGSVAYIQTPASARCTHTPSGARVAAQTSDISHRFGEQHIT